MYWQPSGRETDEMSREGAKREKGNEKKTKTITIAYYSIAHLTRTFCLLVGRWTRYINKHISRVALATVEQLNERHFDMEINCKRTAEKKKNVQER